MGDPNKYIFESLKLRFLRTQAFSAEFFVCWFLGLKPHVFLLVFFLGHCAIVRILVQFRFNVDFGNSLVS